MRKQLMVFFFMTLFGIVIYWYATVLDPSFKTKDKLVVRITAPENNSFVNVYDRVSGLVSDRQAHLWVVVQPLQTQDCWVQKPVIVDSRGIWTASVQFGEDKSLHSGKTYEVRVLANPIQKLVPGRTICWPEADAVSGPLYLTGR